MENTGKKKHQIIKQGLREMSTNLSKLIATLKIKSKKKKLIRRFKTNVANEAGYFQTNKS